MNKKQLDAYASEKTVDLFVILNVAKPSSNDVYNAKTFIKGLLQNASIISEGRPKVSRANLRTMVLKIIMSTIELQDKIKGKSFTISTYLESCLDELLASLEEAGMEVEE